MPAIAATTTETRQNRQSTKLSDPRTHYDPPPSGPRLKLKRTHGVQIQAPGLPIAPEIAIRAKKKPPSIGNAAPDQDPGRRRGRRGGRAAGRSRVPARCRPSHRRWEHEVGTVATGSNIWCLEHYKLLIRLMISRCTFTNEPLFFELIIDRRLSFNNLQFVV